MKKLSLNNGKTLTLDLIDSNTGVSLVVLDDEGNLCDSGYLLTVTEQGFVFIEPRVNPDIPLLKGHYEQVLTVSGDAKEMLKEIYNRTKAEDFPEDVTCSGLTFLLNYLKAKGHGEVLDIFDSVDGEFNVSTKDAKGEITLWKMPCGECMRAHVEEEMTAVILRNACVFAGEEEYLAYRDENMA